MEAPPLSVVVPAFDEALRLPPTLAQISAYVGADPELGGTEIVVVDDGSSDDTAAAADAVQLPATITRRVLRHDRNQGKGAAVRTGFGAARGAWVLLSDADLSSPIDELPVVRAAADQTTVAIGSRALRRELIAVRQPWYRDGMGRVFNLVVRTLLLPGLHDTQCGFKLFPGDLARALARAQRVDGFAFDVELLLIARSWGYRIAEVPVRWAHAEASRVSPLRHSAEMLADVLRLAARRATRRLPPRPAGLAAEPVR